MPSELKKLSKPEIVLQHIPSYQYGCAFFGNQSKERMKFVEREVDCKMEITENSSDFEFSHRTLSRRSQSLLLSTIFWPGQTYSSAARKMFGLSSPVVTVSTERASRANFRSVISRCNYICQQSALRAHPFGRLRLQASKMNIFDRLLVSAMRFNSFLGVPWDSKRDPSMSKRGN